MRILQTTDSVGGVFTFALDLTAYLREQGHEVLLVGLGPPMTAAQRERAEALASAVVEGDFPLEWMPGADARLDACGAWLLEQAGRYGAELVHLNQVAFGHLPWGVPVLSVGHSCVLSWWEAVKGEPAPPEWDRYAFRLGRGLRACDAVLAPTEAMLRSLRKHYGPFRLAGVIPNGRRGELLPEPRIRSGKEPFVLYAGRLWDQAKNAGLLSEAACTGRLRWPIWVAGDAHGPQAEGVALAGLRQLGWLRPDQLEHYYLRAAVYCLPALYEPFGLSALEAACKGCALVLGDIDTLREVWGEDALYVPPRRPDKLVAALNRLAADPELCSAYGLRAARRAGRYALEAMGAGYLRLYHQLLESPRRRSFDPMAKEEAFL
jgi:glycosyltransferase involved in cell wall biosynthesis